MRINRRRALSLLGIGAGLAGLSPVRAQGAPAFAYGVASGDPAADSLLLWTHAGAAGTVRWQVAADRDFKQIVKRGSATTTAARDHTVKVVATGLMPGVTYFYRFLAGKAVSPVGQAKTPPVGPADDLVLVSACCALYPGGYFNAYQAVADLPRVDAVIHLGDYIYESAGEKDGDYAYEIGSPLGRLPDPPAACVTLSDYRRRFAQARRDPQLQAAHARAAWICCWDDHDLANDSWKDGAQAHDDARQGPFSVRKAAAVQAFYEWMPIRDPQKGQAFEAINRSFDFGDLASFTMLETRLTARDHQLTLRDVSRDPSGKPDVAAFAVKLKDPTRRMLSGAQEFWLGLTLKNSVRTGKAWQLIGSGVGLARIAAPDLRAQMVPEAWTALQASITGYYKGALAEDMAMTAYDIPRGLDSWDGYPGARARLYYLIKNAQARCVVLSGDSHMAWVNELRDDAGRRVAAEFGSTALTSPGFGDSLPPGTPLAEAFVKRNREVVFAEAFHKGFVLTTVTRDAVKGELIGVSTVVEKTFETRVIKAFRVVPEGATVSRPVPI